jgi:Zn-dependent peptidase ImmA (M78 family)
LTRAFWITAAKTVLAEINNPYIYNRQALIEYFPQIRWYSTNVERGLTEVIRSLFKLGITVIYQPALPTLQLRGATFAVDDKPCIVLTNYVDFYPTLWFALIHELYHILFDWDDIRVNLYHLTDDGDDQLSVRQREDMADDFARQYLFSKEKSHEVKRFLNDRQFVENFANANHVHPSIIYVFAAWDTGSGDKRAWGRARQQSPSAIKALKYIDIPWDDEQPVEKIAQKRRQDLYL